jgi:hypothetical protein
LVSETVGDAFVRVTFDSETPPAAGCPDPDAGGRLV